MTLKKFIALHAVLLPLLAATATAQNSVYLSADPTYNAEVYKQANAPADLSYDASWPATKPPAIRRPAAIPSILNQATLSAAIAKRDASDTTLKRQTASQISVLGDLHAHPSVLVSAKPAFGISPLAAKQQKASFATPTVTKRGVTKPVIAGHGFSSHQPMPVYHGFKTPDQKVQSYAPRTFTCCGNER